MEKLAKLLARLLTSLLPVSRVFCETKVVRRS